MANLSEENAITKHQGNDLPAVQTELPEFIKKIESFQSKLNEAPTAEADGLDKNKFANNAIFKPISFVQTDLDEFYAGLWNWEMKFCQVVANEIIGWGTLEVFHPIARVWIRRTGCAAVMVQQRSKESGGSGRISDIDDKIKNTLVKDFPHLESECIKNAAKKLGKKFGRDLNRKMEDEYSPIYTEAQENTKGLAEAIQAMKDCKSEDGFRALWDSYGLLNINPEFQKNYQYYFRMNLKKPVKK